MNVPARAPHTAASDHRNCTRCNEVVGVEARRWHVRRYVTGNDLFVSLCATCDAARKGGCAVCSSAALSSVPLCVDCLIRRASGAIGL